MLRTSTVLLVAFLGLAGKYAFRPRPKPIRSRTTHPTTTTAGQDFAALTNNHNKTKTGKVPKTKTPHTKPINLKQTTGFTLCTGEYDAYIGGTNVAGTGAFSYPVSTDCTFAPAQLKTVTPGEANGFYAGVCSENPYEGLTLTAYRERRRASSHQHHWQLH